MRRSALAVGALASVVPWVPAVSTIAPMRRRILPRLAGRSPERHIALTYDDGPDHASTPAFLDLLEAYDVRATFFLLGAHVAEHRGLVEDMVARGHELGVHGWDHQCLAWKRPGTLVGELLRARDVVGEIIGRSPRWYRPPYGVLTAEGLFAAARADLRVVLWSAWGRDWERAVTAEQVAHRVNRTLRPGGTVLLHDTDRTSAPGSWRATLGASRLLLEDWGHRDLEAGPLRDHWRPVTSPG
jgi:peptidoglycan/xylan/chitin deacetylase (PgdA/CDA1 family)